MSTDPEEQSGNGIPEPDAGLGSTADPMAFGAALAGLGKRLAGDPALLAASALRFAAGLAEISAAVTARALGSTTSGPIATEPDARFSDPTWESNPGFYGLRQCYLLWSSTMKDLATAARDEELGGKAEFAVAQLVDAAAPTNFLLGNPEALKRAFETGGFSVIRGLTRFLEDVATNGGWPRQVDTGALELGVDLAATPGKVVHRNRLMELIQFAPRTDTVHEKPLLLSPPWINKYYVMDLAPGKSFAEWAIDHGHTVFCISYRNPDESFRDIGLRGLSARGTARGAGRHRGDHRREAGQRRGALPRRNIDGGHARPPRANEGRPSSRRLGDAVERPGRLQRAGTARALRRPGKRRAAREAHGGTRLPRRR